MQTAPNQSSMTKKSKNLEENTIAAETTEALPEVVAVETVVPTEVVIVVATVTLAVVEVVTTTSAEVDTKTSAEMATMITTMKTEEAVLMQQEARADLGVTKILKNKKIEMSRSRLPCPSRRGLTRIRSFIRFLIKRRSGLRFEKIIPH